MIRQHDGSKGGEGGCFLSVETDVKLAQKGDREAFVRLVRQFEGSLYRVASPILKKDEDCADAIQDTVLSAYRSIHKLKEPSFFKTWLIRILINQCKRILNKRNKILFIAEMKEEGRQEAWERIELREAVNRLEDALRIVIVLHYFEDMSVREMAELLDVSEGTVKSRLYRARQELAAMWQLRERVMNGE
jgi:RNA polymerase sigma-70 factor (ECF subfamily)